jgi:hypothetical protein
MPRGARVAAETRWRSGESHDKSGDESGDADTVVSNGIRLFRARRPGFSGRAVSVRLQQRSGGSVDAGNGGYAKDAWKGRLDERSF